jgi:hypothetical protein
MSSAISEPHFPFVMPIENSVRNEYGSVFSTTIPREAEELRHDRRGNPVIGDAAIRVDPGRQCGDLDRVEHAVARAEVTEPVPSGARREHPPVARRREQVGDGIDERRAVHRVALPRLEPPVRASISRISRPSCSIARRKSIASRMHSSVSPGPASAIIFADTSVEAMMLYCGEVEVCIMNASLNKAGSTGMRPQRTWIIDACERASEQLVRGMGDRDGGVTRRSPPRCMP